MREFSRLEYLRYCILLNNNAFHDPENRISLKMNIHWKMLKEYAFHCYLVRYLWI